MPYIGQELYVPTTSNFVLDQFTATAGQTAFTLSQAPASANAIVVGINGILQEPGVGYTISGTTMTTTSGVPVGMHVFVVHIGFRTAILAPADGSVQFTSLMSTLVATQAELEAQTVNKLVTAALLKYHPGVPKAWVNFNGTGVVAIRSSYNVTSITDNGVGDYTINFTTAFSGTTYTPVFGHSPSGVSGAVGAWNVGVKTDAVGVPTTKTASAVQIRVLDSTGASVDAPEVYAAFFGDQ